MKKEYIAPCVSVVGVNATLSILESSMIDAGGKTPSFDAKESFVYDDEEVEE